MKCKLIIGVCLFWGMVVHATIFPPQTGFNTLLTNILTVTQATVSTNQVSVTNYVEMNLYHTLFFNVATNGETQNVVFVTDVSGDGLNWAPKATNSILSTGGSDLTTLLGKFTYIRVRSTETNATGSAIYLGGR